MTTPALQQAPFPFEIVEENGMRAASNGGGTLSVYLDEGGFIKKRRAVTISTAQPSTEAVIPQLNTLATEMLANPQMTAAEVHAKLSQLAGSVEPPRPVPKAEWVYAELDGIRAYFNGRDVILTRKDLTP